MLRDDINSALKEAMKAGQARRVSTLRLINAAILERETKGAERVSCSDAEIVDVMGKMVKQRQESLDIYEKAGRAELAAQEREEIEIISAYLPKQMSDIEAAARDLRADQGTRGRDHQGHGPHHGGAQAALLRADRHRQGQRAGEETARRLTGSNIMSSCLVRGVRSVEFVVTNLDEAARFYEEVVESRMPRPETRNDARFFRGTAGYHHLLGLACRRAACGCAHPFRCRRPRRRSTRCTGLSRRPAPGPPRRQN